MHYCDNNDGVVFNPIIDAEWKPVYQRSPSVSVNDRVSEWSFCYRGQYSQHFVEKLVAQPGQSFLIPNCCIRLILFRLRSETNLKGHNLWRMSATASVARRP